MAMFDWRGVLLIEPSSLLHKPVGILLFQSNLELYPQLPIIPNSCVQIIPNTKNQPAWGGLPATNHHVSL